MKLEKGKKYLLQNPSSRHPDIFRARCLDVTNTCYYLESDDGRKFWVEKSKFSEPAFCEVREKL